MGKLREKVLVLGEGPTEFYYFKSLCDVYKNLTVKPDYPKHTNMHELEEKISDGIDKGYSHIFCVIDMDTKNKESENIQYQKLKSRYANPINKARKGIHCEVRFFETHRCTELFFLYYFQYTSRIYNEQEKLLKELNKYVKYEKTTDFFRKCNGLHRYFENKGGSLNSAITNADRSLEEKKSDNRVYTYSELGQLMRILKERNE